MSIDLEDLRIDHEKAVTSARPSRVWMLLFFILLAVVVVAGALLWRQWSALGGGAVGGNGNGGGVPVHVERLPRAGGGAGAGFSAAGWIKLPLTHPVLVTPLLAGRLEAIAVIEGDPVRQGQVLARLYDGDLRAELQVAEARLRAATAAHDKAVRGYRRQEVAEAAAEVDRLEAELQTARTVVTRSRELQPSGAVALEELQADETRVATLAASLGKARERHGLLAEGTRSEDIALALAARQEAAAQRDLAQLRLGYTEIKSPIDGVVLVRAGRVGQWVTPGAGAIVNLFDPEDLQARVDVNQDDIAKVFIGQAVEIRSRAAPGQPRRGEVALIEPQADLVKNTVPVRVRIEPEKGLALHPDMVVTARFERVSADPEAGKGGDPGAEPALTVPELAVRGPEGERFVWLVRQGVALRRRVDLGALRATRYVVVSGLSGGEVVILDAPPSLTQGAEVHVVE